MFNKSPNILIHLKETLNGVTDKKKIIVGVGVLSDWYGIEPDGGELDHAARLGASLWPDRSRSNG